MMKIRHSETGDLNRIMELYSHARQFMAEHGNPKQWGTTNWPPQELIEKDIEAHKSYVCVNEDGTVVGTFFFTHGKDIEPTYREISEGGWIGDDSYGVVHRIATDHSERGIGRFCLEWAFSECGHLRIDTHADNTVMQSLLKKLGFTYCGIIYACEDKDPRFAYEKM